MKLFLIRHGRTASNELDLVTGSPFASLSETGRTELEASAPGIRSMMGHRPNRFVVSSLSRAKETAQILFPDKAWEVDARLAETDAGQAAELSNTEFVELYGQRRPDFSVPYPGGESHQNLKNRVLRWFDELAGCTAECMVVVTHAGPINILLHHLLGVPYPDFPNFQIENMSVTKLHFSSDLQLLNHEIGCFSKYQHKLKISR